MDVNMLPDLPDKRVFKVKQYPAARKMKFITTEQT